MKIRDKFHQFLILILALIPIVEPQGNSVGLCDGEYFVLKTQEECKYGLNFGANVPKCICINGVYRMYMENCDQGIGFAKSVCVKTFDEGTGLKVKGLQLTSPVDFDSVGVVLLKSGGSSQKPDWDYIGKGGGSKNIAGERFYVLNGIAKITVGKSLSGNRKQTICIERNSNAKEDNICMYRHTDNVDNWHLEKPNPYATSVMVQDKCTGTNLKTMHIHKCFRPLGILDSDCQVPCMKSNLMSRGGVMGESLDGPWDMEQNCTDPKKFFTHENKFIDRQLLTYMVVDQTTEEGNVTIPEPDPEKYPGLTKVYELYELVKQIAMTSCQFTYLRPSVWEWASKFFLFLHKANKLKYDIPIQETHATWIKDILTKCLENHTMITLTANANNPGCNTEKRAKGYCNQKEGKETAPCDFVPVKISPTYLDFTSKHFVPEFPWLFLDIVHMNCFKEFNDSYRMFHVLEQAYEKLFSAPIKDLWYFPTWTEKTRRSLFTILADDIMWNAEVCAESIYKFHANKLYRLQRPEMAKNKGRKKRSESIGSWDVTCATKKADFQYPPVCRKNPVPNKEYLVSGS